jgi:hypothetical protein
MDATKIARFWRRYSSLSELKRVKQCIHDRLDKESLQDLMNYCSSIQSACTGDGAGLSGGMLIDMAICAYFKEKIPEYEEFHKNESDMKIAGIKLSQKKINGKSTLALNWSKNDKSEKMKVAKSTFDDHIMVLNLKSGKWWKTNPIKKSCLNITYNDSIPLGIYLIDRKFCKCHIKLSSNNKTNTLISEQQLYSMLKYSIRQQLYIELPAPNKKLSFNILKACS